MEKSSDGHRDAEERRDSAVVLYRDTVVHLTSKRSLEFKTKKATVEFPSNGTNPLEEALVSLDGPHDTQLTLLSKVRSTSSAIASCDGRDVALRSHLTSTERMNRGQN